MRLILFPDKNPVSQLFTAIFVSLSSFLLIYLLAMFLAKFIYGNEIVQLVQEGNIKNPALTGILRYLQIVLSASLFIIPPIILAYLYSEKPLSYLSANHFPFTKEFIIVLFIMISAVPLINYLTFLNMQIKFPAFLSGLENYFIKTEKAATEQTEVFLKMHSLSDLIFNIFMMALLPAIGEELMFRGVLQKIFTHMTRNIHWGIIISSFLFSAIHFQFYGLFPRWLLGLFFGYMLVFSGSIWLPITAHFLNNAMIVISQYYIIPDKKVHNPVDFGSAPEMLPYAVLSLVIVITGFIYLSKVRNKKTGFSMN